MDGSQVGGAENAGLDNHNDGPVPWVENAILENDGPNHRAGK